MEELVKGNNPIIDRISTHYPDCIAFLRKQKKRLFGNTSRSPILVLGEYHKLACVHAETK